MNLNELYTGRPGPWPGKGLLEAVRSLVLAWLLLTLPGFAAQPGDPAPPVSLPALGGGQIQVSSLLSGGPVLLWFPAVNPETLRSAAGLQQLASQHGARLVMVPVVGSNAAQAQQLAAAAPGATVLLDSDGRVTLSYTGEFIPGVGPNPNLFILSRAGKILAARQFPGVPPEALTQVLTNGQ